MPLPFEVIGSLLVVLFELDLVDEVAPDPPVALGTVGSVRLVLSGTELPGLVPNPVGLNPVVKRTELLLLVPRAREDELAPVPREIAPLLGALGPGLKPVVLLAGTGYGALAGMEGSDKPGEGDAMTHSYPEG